MGTVSPDGAQRSRPWNAKKIAIVAAVLLLVGLLVLVFRGRENLPGFSKPSETVSPESVKLKPGPWGDVEYVPITIDAPEELLGVKKVEEAKVEWFFKGFSRESLGKFLDHLGVSSGQRNQLLDPRVLSNAPDGLTMAPPREAILALSPAALDGIYRTLGPSKVNESSKWEFLSSYLDKFRINGVSEETEALVRKFSIVNGKFLICYCMPFVFSGVQAYPEKVALAKALTQQKTMLLKLHVSPQTDINSLAAYWGKAFWTTDVKAILESLKELPHGGTMDVIELLPPIPTSLLYTYPIPPSTLHGSFISKNCTWTAFNFFRDPPDSNYSNPYYVMKKIESEYFPVNSDPRYGDVVLFLTPDDFLVHAAVFVADDIVYSKNGDNTNHPWIFTRISDLTESFSYAVPQGQSLSVFYYRNKYY